MAADKHAFMACCIALSRARQMNTHHSSPLESGLEQTTLGTEDNILTNGKKNPLGVFYGLCVLCG